MNDALSARLHKADISELMSRYCQAVIHADGDALAELFVEDGGIETPGNWFRGRKAIAEFITGLRGSVLPMIHNQVITVEGSRGQGWSVVHSPVGGPGDNGFVAEYSDEYELIDSRWYFRERRINMLKQL